MDSAFTFAINNGGIDSARTCNYNKLNKKALTIDGYQDVAQEESALLCAVARQPISVGIDGKSLDFQLYAGGIYDGECSSNPDDLSHAVLIVGYGSEGGVDYWIIKNSWGKSWGIEGYAYIKRNTMGFVLLIHWHLIPQKNRLPFHHSLQFLHHLLQNQIYVKTAYITVQKVKHAAVA